MFLSKRKALTAPIKSLEPRHHAVCRSPHQKSRTLQSCCVQESPYPAVVMPMFPSTHKTPGHLQLHPAHEQQRDPGQQHNNGVEGIAAAPHYSGHKRPLPGAPLHTLMPRNEIGLESEGHIWVLVARAFTDDGSLRSSINCEILLPGGCALSSRFSQVVDHGERFGGVFLAGSSGVCFWLKICM